MWSKCWSHCIIACLISKRTIRYMHASASLTHSNRFPSLEIQTEIVLKPLVFTLPMTVRCPIVITFTLPMTVRCPIVIMFTHSCVNKTNHFYYIYHICSLYMWCNTMNEHTHTHTNHMWIFYQPISHAQSNLPTYVTKLRSWWQTFHNGAVICIETRTLNQTCGRSLNVLSYYGRSLNAWEEFERIGGV